LLNEKRQATEEIEARTKVRITVVANRWLETPRFEIQRLRTSETIDEPSYALATGEEVESLPAQVEAQPRPAPEPAAVSGIQRTTAPAPRPETSSFLAWLKSLLISIFGAQGKQRSERKRTQAQKRAGRRSGQAAGKSQP